MQRSSVILIVTYASLIILIMAGNSSSVPQDPEYSATGQVIWNDLEGGFFGILTVDGAKYQPINLPDIYTYPGVTVNITFSKPTDLVTMQMWGAPIEIRSISAVRTNNPFLKPWYQNESNIAVNADVSQSDHLTIAAAGLQSGLDGIDLQISSIARNISKTGIWKKDYETELNEGLAIPGVLEVVLLDNRGTIKTIVPKESKKFEGENVSKQEFTSELISYPAPGMSGYFTTVEGVDAVIISWPVFSGAKNIAGFVSALVDPAELTRKSAIPMLNATTLQLMVAEPDGKILYDDHPDVKGQVICNNSVFSAYPALLSWATHLQNALAGVDQYSFYKEDSPEVVTTDVIWTTVSLHGTPWRVCVLKREQTGEAGGGIES